MAHHAIDALARSAGDRTSRRGMLGGFTALALGLGWASLPGATAARNKRQRQHRRKKKITGATCQSGTERCQGQCVAPCLGEQTRNPVTCGCCQMNAKTCEPIGDNDACCSGMCAQATDPAGVAKLGNACAGRSIAAPCDFSAQCASGFCSPAGVCLFVAP